MPLHEHSYPVMNEPPLYGFRVYVSLFVRRCLDCVLVRLVPVFQWLVIVSIVHANRSDAAVSKRFHHRSE